VIGRSTFQRSPTVASIYEIRMTAKKTTRTIQNAIRNPEVSAMVERELMQRPTFSHRVLQTLAAELDPSVGEMDPRLFHAEYVVPAQGRIAAAKGGKRRRRKTTRAGATTRIRRSRATGADQAAPATQAVGEVVPVAEVQAEAGAPAHEVDAAAAIAADAPAPSVSEPEAEPRAEPAAPAASPEEHRRRRVRESPTEPGRARARAPRSRERVRAVRAAFFAWARELADADSPAAMVEAFDHVDRYVDTVLKV
jgi:hypothetical protein